MTAKQPGDSPILEKNRRTFLKQMGVPWKEAMFRQSGRSTRQAFEILAECYQHRGEWVSIRDHHGTKEASDFLRRTITQMITLLGFSGFEFDRVGNKVRLLK